MIQILCIRKRETVSYLQYAYALDFMHQKEGNCVIPTICLCSRFFCIRKRETVSYLQYIHVLDFLYQKEENCIVPTLCSFSRFCVSERGKLHHTYNTFMIQLLCIRKGETVLYLQYIYVLEFVYQKGENCIIPTIRLCSSFCVSERGKLYYTCSMFMFQILNLKKEGYCIIPTMGFCSADFAEKIR